VCLSILSVTFWLLAIMVSLGDNPTAIGYTLALLFLTATLAALLYTQR